MLNGTMINLNYKPENPYVVRHKGVIIDAIHSQAFLFGEFNMGKFKRKVPLCTCACGCGERVKWNKRYKRYNKFIYTHHYRGQNHWRYGHDKYAIEKAKPVPLCACGCKQGVKWCSMKKQYNIYIHQHQHIGKKRPEFSGSNHPMFGKKHPNRNKKIHSQQTRNAHSKFMKALGDNHPMKRPEIVAKITGKNSPLYGKLGPDALGWKGGLSIEPYCDIWRDNEYKEDIRKRDNYTCQNPHCKGNCNHLTLHIHHIDGNKKNCHPWNLIALCCSCNRRAEGNKDISRIWWQKLYQNIMTEKYDYQYD